MKKKKWEMFHLSLTVGKGEIKNITVGKGGGGCSTNGHMTVGKEGGGGGGGGAGGEGRRVGEKRSRLGPKASFLRAGRPGPACWRPLLLAISGERKT